MASEKKIYTIAIERFWLWKQKKSNKRIWKTNKNNNNNDDKKSLNE